MPADTLSREEIERVQENLDTLGFVDLDDATMLLQATLSEPARLASARAEGVREGIEMAAQWHADQAAAIDERIAKRGQVEFVSGLGRVACFHRQFATDMLTALSPPPAEPTWTPTHRHYKGRLYRELMRVDREGDCEPMVVYEAEDGRRWTRPAAQFDGMVAAYDLGGGVSPTDEYVRRFAPIAGAPSEPTGGTAEPVQTGAGWIEWSGGECPVQPGDMIDVRYQNGMVLSGNGVGWDWHIPGDIIAYRIVQPAEPSAPVAPLTRCQAASLRNDGECWHKQCPVPDELGPVSRLHCTLPGGGVDYVDEDDLPPSAPVAEGE